MSDYRAIIQLFDEHPVLYELFEHPQILKLLPLRIEGMEVTQGIQFYDAAKHMTDASDRGPDNSLTLVAAKPAWVRVYVSSLFASLSGVSGTLEVYKRIGGVLWKKIATLSPMAPGSVTAQRNADYATVRGTITDTLNFVIPADEMCGHLRLVAKLSTSGGYSATSSEDIDVTLRQTLSMRIVPVQYNGVDAGGNPLAIAAPTLTTAQGTAAWSTKVYPVESTPAISLAAGVTLTFPLTGAPANAGGCAQSWIDLNVLVAQARNADGNQPNTFYYGLVPPGVPLGTNSGCASSGVTSGISTGSITMAHEFGHALGFPHAPCGGVGASADPSYPAYEPYDPAATPAGSIGEYGLDVDTGAIKDPASFRDFMGYCNPDWISIYNHGRAIQNAMLQPRTVCEDRLWWDDWRVYDPWWWIENPPEFEFSHELPYRVDLREPVIAIIGVFDVGGHFELRSMTRTLAVPQVTGGTATGMFAELVDHNGERLAAGALRRLASEGHGCGCGGGCESDDDGPALVQAFVRTDERGAVLRISTKEREIWRATAPEKAPAPARLRASIEGKCLALDWGCDEGTADHEVWIRCTQERGEPRVIWIGRSRGKLELDLGVLPVGAVRIDALIHDGFDAVSCEALSLEIPARAPSAVVMHPMQDHKLRAGYPLRLHGLGNACDGSLTKSDQCCWRLDGKVVGKGNDLWIEAPSTGTHELVFEVEDRHGKTVVKRTFETIAVAD